MTLVVPLSMFGLLRELKFPALPLPEAPLFCTGDKHFLQTKIKKITQFVNFSQKCFICMKKKLTDYLSNPEQPCLLDRYLDCPAARHCFCLIPSFSVYFEKTSEYSHCNSADYN